MKITEENIFIMNSVPMIEMLLKYPSLVPNAFGKGLGEIYES